MPETQPTTPAPLYPPSEQERVATVRSRVLTEEQRAALETIRTRGTDGIGSWLIPCAILDALGARICRRDVNAASTERDQIVTMAPALTKTQVYDLQAMALSPRYLDGSTTIRKLRGAGYIAGKGPYAITPAGRARLEVL